VSDQLKTLVRAAKTIPDLHKKEHPDRSDPLGADEFLPIFIYVLVQAELEHVCVLKEILGALCEPRQRLSETGYYTATFAAAVEHIKELDVVGARTLQ
jgi:hypothetical protein